MITEKEATEIKEIVKEALEEDRKKRHELYLGSFMNGLIGALIFCLIITIFFMGNFSFVSGIVGGFILFFDIWFIYEFVKLPYA